MMVPSEAIFNVSYGQFQLTDYNVIPEPDGDIGGLLTPLRGGATVACGIHTGPVRVRAEAHAAAPPPDDHAWDECAEMTFEAPVGRVRVTPLFEDPVPELPQLTSGPGTYRIRVYARGRDAARGRVVPSSSEEYLLQVWPEPPPP
jgi:hypothetical protein